MWFIGVEVEQETSAPPPKKILDPPLGLLFPPKNVDFRAVSVTEQSCFTPISKVERHISDSFCSILWCCVNTYSDRSGTE